MSSDGFEAELGFWDRELSLGGEYAEGVRNRLDPERMHLSYPTYFLKYVDALEKIHGSPVSVLDLGSGPLSMLALGARQGRYRLTSADPLAEDYLRLLDKHGHTPPWPLVKCFGERLLECFAPSSFHCVWSHNALDHTRDPVLVFRNMVAVLRPGGYLIVQAWCREGTAAGWTGLHQHDLILAETGRLLLGSRDSSSPVCLSEGLPLEVIESSDAVDRPRVWIRVVYRKHP
jgi:SAM-dependent methyltransferase